tara:strand:+ start:1079 stop:1201 length:123 start_codon:yes stop_codon:yes gene_type:complete
MKETSVFIASRNKILVNPAKYLSSKSLYLVIMSPSGKREK